jgi:hypothetical protein
MPTIRSLQLLLHTRERPEASISWLSSLDAVRLFVGENPVNLSDPFLPLSQLVPPDGKMSRVATPADVNIPYDELLTKGVSVGVDRDAWAPRSAFLFGLVTDNPPPLPPSGGRWVPLAQNFLMTPNLLVSKDPNDLVGANAGGMHFVGVTDRWRLSPITESRPDERLSALVLLMITRPSRLPDGRTANTKTNEPLQFSAFTDVLGEPVLMYQAVLPELGTQKPGEAQGIYFIRLPVEAGPGFTPSRLQSAQIAVLSDDAWSPHEIWLFGLSGDGRLGCLLGRRKLGHDGDWFSQDPNDSLIPSEAAVPVVSVPLNPGA